MITKEKISDLYDLANYINQSEDYPIDIEDICNQHNWEIGKDYVVAIDYENNYKLCISDNGVACVYDLLVKKETRVYGVQEHDYHENMTKEEFITIAENNGYVWSLKGFNELDKPISNLILRIFKISC